MRGPAAVSVTIGEWLPQAAARHPERTCFELIDGSTRSYEATNSRVNRLVSALGEEGVGRGDRIAIIATDCAEYVETLLATMKLGATYVPLNFRLSAGELSTLLERAAPRAVLYGPAYAAAATACSSSTIEVMFGSPYEELLRSGSEHEPPVVADDRDTLGLAFTSGTTGLPKGVLQSQRMIKHMVMNCLVDYRARPEDVRYNAAPLFHISGMAMTFMAIAVGSTTVIAPQFGATRTLDLLAADRLTACFLVPTMISALLAEPNVGRRRYERLELMMYGGAPMSPSLLRRAIDVFDCDFLNAFGAGTEAGLQTVLTPADHRRALAGDVGLLGSIGRAATGVSLRLVDQQGNDVRRGEVGEIATRSDTVMDGYLDDPAATAAAIRDGWFHAGDLARQDEEGYLYLEGRTDDMIIRGGENIHPLEIEQVISSHPTVDQAVVIGIPDDHWGQVLAAHVIARPGHAIDAAALDEHCRARLAGFKVPQVWNVVDAFPLSASGKVLRRELRAASRPHANHHQTGATS